MDHLITNYLTIDQPHKILSQWISEAECRDPNAMIIATNNNSKISTRTVLAKSISHEGVKFYTNYNSAKAQGLIKTGSISATFFWHNLHRQVHIRGTAVKTSREDSVSYWNSRSPASQLSQYISRQSQKCPSKEHLQTLYKEAQETFKDQPVPCPEHWGGFLIKAEAWELWMGQDHRLHDRFLYTMDNGKYIGSRLYP